MPTSKSSTSNRDAFAYSDDALRAQIDQWARDENYKELLTELLCRIHRDGGQFTTLSGYSVSTLEAINQVTNMRRKLTSLLFGKRARS